MNRLFGSSNPAMLAAIAAITAGGVVFALTGGSYFTFVVALVALTRSSASASTSSSV